MERLYTIILLTIISVFEIILLLNRELLPYELVVILMFLVLVFMMLFMLNQRYFWNLALLAFVLNLINIAYLVLIFGRGYILYMATALAFVGMLISLLSIVKRKRRKVVEKQETKLPKEEPSKSVEIEREIRGITLEKPRVIIEEYKPVVAKPKVVKKISGKRSLPDDARKSKISNIAKKKATKKRTTKKKAKKKVVKKTTRKRALFVASSNAKTYHNLKCDWSNNIKKKNKVTFASKKAAKKAGFIAHSCVDPNYKPKPKRKKVVKKATVKKVVAKKRVPSFVASTKAKTYHTAKCNWADNIKRGNKIRFSSRKKAEDLGLKPHECVTGKKVVRKAKKKVVKKKVVKKTAKKVKQVKKTYKPGKYVASTKGAVYHVPKCKWANNIERKNRVWFNSRQKAEQLGYSAHSCLK